MYNCIFHKKVYPSWEVYLLVVHLLIIRYTLRGWGQSSPELVEEHHLHCQGHHLWEITNSIIVVNNIDEYY